MSSEAMNTVTEKIAEQKVSELMGARFELRHRARRAYVRLVLEVPTPLADGNEIRWDELALDPASVETEVDEEAIASWLGPSTPRALVSRLSSILHPDLAEPITADRYLTLVAQRALEHLPAALVHHLDGSERARERVEGLAGPLVSALVAELQPETSSSKLLDTLPADALAPYLEALATSDAVLTSYKLRQLARGAPHAAEAVATLAARTAAKEPKRDVDHLWIDLGPLDADGIASILAAVKGKDAHFRRLAFLCAAAATPAAADALAGFLGDRKRGRTAARWLAMLGAEGRRAAAEAAAGATKKSQGDQRVRELAAAVATLPDAPSILAAIGNQPSAWSLDVERFALDSSELTPAPGDPPHPPIALADAERVMKDKEHEASDLAPHEWADLLAIVTIRGWRDDFAWAHERALATGMLGWGGDPARLVAAIARFDFDATILLGWRSDGAIGLYHMLLGCGASRAVLLHALAVFARRRGPIVMGCATRNFEEPLKTWKVEEKDALAILVMHLQIARHNRIGADEILRYPVLEEASSAGTSWRSREPRRDFRLRVAVSGATRVVVRFRGEVEVAVDVPTRRWSQKGLGSNGGGATSLLGGERAVMLDVESVAGGVRLGVNGTHVEGAPRGHLFEGAPEVVAPIEVETDGRIERVRVTAMASQRAAGDLVRLVGYEEQKAVRDVADAADTTAALALAAEASLGDDEAVAKSAAEALAAMPALADPWRAALGMEHAEPAVAQFPLRSFEECVAVWKARRKKEPVRAEGTSGFAHLVAFGAPDSPEWTGDAIAEDTLYLVEGNGWQGEAVSGVEALMHTSLPAITTWNSRGSGAWAGEADTWMLLVSDDLMQEQDDDWGNFMSLTLAAWKVEEGVALAAWKGDREELGAIMGLPGGWPARRAWTDIDVWIGE